MHEYLIEEFATTPVFEIKGGIMCSAQDDYFSSPF